MHRFESPSVVCFDLIRRRCAEVARRARSVRIDEDALISLARDLVTTASPPVELDPAHHSLVGSQETLAFVVTLDAINFGSGWFPQLKKRPGLSGYLTVAATMRERFERQGSFRADELAGLQAEDCAHLLGQDPTSDGVSELMALYAKALRDLGTFLLDRYAGRFEGLVEEAEGSAAALAGLLTTMPFYRDVSHYEELEVPFYKRAQITVADLHLAFRGAGYGAFRDVDELTLFADNLVPHVLRMEGVLIYDADLVQRIEAGERLLQGSAEEVEIRASALDAVERMAAAVRSREGHTTVRALDTLLWTRGQRPDFKAHPRHRTRTTYY